jgi:hypothetical protein
MVVVLLGRQAEGLLVAFVAQEQEAELQIAVFRSDDVVAGEFDQEVQVDLQAFHPLRQGADLPEFGLGVVLEDVDERPHAAHAFRGLLDFDFMGGSSHEVFSQRLVLIGQEAGDGFEAHNDVLKRSHLRRHLEATDQFQRLVPAKLEQFIEKIGSLFLRRRLLAKIFFMVEPIVEVEGPGGFGID